MVIKNRNKTYMKTIIFLCLLFCISSCNKIQTFYCVKGIVYSKKDREIKKEYGLLNYGVEEDLYPDEIKDLILSIIESYYKNTDLDKNDRQYKILEDIINKNLKLEYANEIIRECKRIFTNYSSITKKMKSDLSKLKLEIKKPWAPVGIPLKDVSVEEMMEIISENQDKSIIEAFNVEYSNLEAAYLNLLKETGGEMNV